MLRATFCSQKFLELEERDPNCSAKSNSVGSKAETPVVQLDGITAYWDPVRLVMSLLL